MTKDEIEALLRSGVKVEALLRSGALKLDDWPYRSPLDQPLYVDLKLWGDADPMWGGDSKSRYQEEIHQEIERRWNSLWRFYDIAVGDWEAMGRALARQHVPGLQTTDKRPEPRRRRGPPRKEAVPIFLVVAAKKAALASKKSSSKVTTNRALKAIYEARPWPPALGKRPPSFGAFKAHYLRCKERLDKARKVSPLFDLGVRAVEYQLSLDPGRCLRDLARIQQQPGDGSSPSTKNSR